MIFFLALAVAGVAGCLQASDDKGDGYGGDAEIPPRYDTNWYGWPVDKSVMISFQELPAYFLPPEYLTLESNKDWDGTQGPFLPGVNYVTDSAGTILGTFVARVRSSGGYLFKAANGYIFGMTLEGGEIGEMFTMYEGGLKSALPGTWAVMDADFFLRLENKDGQGIEPAEFDGFFFYDPIFRYGYMLVYREVLVAYASTNWSFKMGIDVNGTGTWNVEWTHPTDRPEVRAYDLRLASPRLAEYPDANSLTFPLQEYPIKVKP